MPKLPFRVTMLIEDHPCEVMKLITVMGLKASVENVKLRESVTDHVLLFESKVKNEDAFKLKSSNVKVLRLTDSKIWVRTNGCAVCRVLYTSDVVIEKIKVVKEKTLLYTLLVPNTQSLKDFLSKLTNQGIKVTVINTDEISSNELTERQMEILKLAYKLGYFDDERGITLTELANKLNISPPTLEEILRKALRKVVKYYLDKVG
ncbi:helix-turn-helix domain-containing protein [Stygiolobus caldivivus]|uniref:DNA-directed RNA polymerase sigma-70 factor n=1 Tax=Stygiolobus caldivivus TaxID=2824673 RepID=A0A8D5ZIQ6_9CREN|nr:helix-turn-helix domain-containing protein [Stygiolobus caldivivus]BCU69841.1 DNA-directed RNA polymerase sigma-70 factor [Stygiolobus caldivivus]